MVSNESWQKLFAPKSVAVIGASNTTGSWGERITRHLLGPKNRTVYAVNPGYSEVQGLTSYKSVTEIPGRIDLGVIVVRAELVPKAMRELVEKEVKAALIISGGFVETDDNGAKLEAEIIDIAQKGGIRFIGPNTMGHLDNTSNMNTLSFIENMPSGPISLVAQSGNIGTRIMHNLMRYGVGFNKFVCCGNEANIKLEDYLEFFASDPNTSVILLYIEGLRDAERFLKVAKKITPNKPIIAMKSGSTENSARASKSHTGALTGSDSVYSAAFKQAGIIRVDDDQELCDIAIALLNQPLPRNSNVGILTMGGGLGVVTAEACEKEGFEIADLEASTIEKFDELLPARWSHGNPVDLVGANMAHGPDIMTAFWILMEDNNLGTVISNAWLGRNFRNREPSSTKTGEYEGVKEEKVRELRARVAKYGKPLLMVSSPPQHPDDLLAFTTYHKEGFTIFPQPNQAARTLRHMNWYRQYLDSLKK